MRPFSRVPLNLKVVIFLYYFSSFYPFIKVPIVGNLILLSIFVFLLMKERSVVKLISSQTVVWFFIGYLLLVFTLSVLARHGFPQTSILYAYRLVRYVPDFMIGIYLMQKRDGLRFLFLTILFSGAVTSLGSVVYNYYYYGNFGGSALRELHNLTMEGREDLADYRNIKAAGVSSVNMAGARPYYLVFCIFYLLTTFSQERPLKRFYFLILSSIFLVGTVLTGLALPFILTSSGILIGLITSRFRIKEALLGILSLSVLGAGIVGSYLLQLEVFTRYFDKALAIFKAAIGQEGTLLDIDRYVLFKISWDTFVQSPFVGVGGEVFIGDYDSIFVGGHSGLGDFLAQYGILGAFPFVILLVFTVNRYLYFYKSSKEEVHNRFIKVFLVLLLMYVCHSFVNPTFGASEINQMAFLMLGVFLGYTNNFVLPPAHPRFRFKNGLQASGRF